MGCIVDRFVSRPLFESIKQRISHFATFLVPPWNPKARFHCDTVDTLRPDDVS